MSCTLALNFRFNQLPFPTKMPHIVIEYTPNLTDLPFNAMLDAVTRRLAESTEVQDEADLKARVVRADHFRVGLEDSGRGFIHITIRIMAGRNTQAKQDFSQRVTDGMLEHMPKFGEEMTVHLSVEVVDIERESYRKVKLS
tara:strand:+ start:30202 stop:30624 length:423 start_codon:yes stop_codon:yes gene_type:complete